MRYLRDGEVLIVPLGGLGEVGMNMMAYISGETLMLVDAGALFPEHSLLGIDLIIPDTTFLQEHRDLFKAVVVTHGHEDHIGALPFLLKEFNVPVYATRFTKALIEARLKDAGVHDRKVRLIKPGHRFSIGEFEVLPVEVTHSIPDAVSLAIFSPAGLIVHTGDFKIDLTPSDGAQFDFSTFSALGDSGVRLLLMDSTNSMVPGYTASERDVYISFENIFHTHRGRLIVTMFSSAIPRIISLLELALQHRRKVAVVGRSLELNLEIARKLRIVDVPDDLFISPEELDEYPAHRILILATGSQGEPRSALRRIAQEQHPLVEIRDGDLVVFSARQIPGNERAINYVINHLMLLGAKVYTERGSRLVHASGHACRGELRTMLELTRPEYFVPIHGEPHHLITNARLALEMGVREDNIFFVQNGEPLLLTRQGLFREEPVITGKVFVDGRGVGDVEAPVLRDRMKLAQTGIVICVLMLDSLSWRILDGPDFIQRGFTAEEFMEELTADAAEIVRNTINEIKKRKHADIPALEEELRIRLRRYFNGVLDRKPVVIPIVMAA